MTIRQQSYLESMTNRKSILDLPVPRRRLGANGPSVSAIGLGCMGMSEFYGPAEEGENAGVLHHALDIGINFLDTADMYGVGRNEELLGRVLRGRRNEVVLATKFGNVRGADGAFLGIDGSAAYVAQACDASLKRLGVDHIDLYYQHRVDPKVPIEETVGAMVRLVDAGKILHLGLSEASADTIDRAARVHPIAALQSEYSLWTRDVAAGVLPTLRKHGIGLVAYSPLGRGFLTGAIASVDDLAKDDWRRTLPRFQGDNFHLNREIVVEVQRLAERCHCTAAQVALAWLLGQGDDIVPIPGTRRISRLDENAAATRLDLGDELRTLDRILENYNASGTRYPPAAMASLGR